MLILGTTIRKLHCGHQTHKLEPEMVACGLLDQLGAEFGTSWYACVVFSDGRVSMRGLTATTPGPNNHVRDIMYRTGVKLNRDLHHNGCWVVVWHVDRLHFMWRDWDGDAAFITQMDEPWPRINRWSVQEFCERVETSFETFRALLRVAELKPEHTVKKAQGEPSRAPTRH